MSSSGSPQSSPAPRKRKGNGGSEAKAAAASPAAAAASGGKAAAAAAGQSAADAKLRKMLVRTWTTLAMIALFCALVYLGHVALVALVVVLVLVVFKEIKDISYAHSKLPGDASVGRMTRMVDWYICLAAVYFLLGRQLKDRFPALVALEGGDHLRFLATYHSLLSFGLFVFALLGFVLNLQKGFYKAQFKQLAWTIVIIALTVVQTSFHIANIFDGLFWFILPALLIVCNDIWAYIWGMMFGRTPLIQLSPNKTWEGFIGAIFSTLLFGFLLAGLLAAYDPLVCPRTDLLAAPTDGCLRPAAFRLRDYAVPQAVRALPAVGPLLPAALSLYPVQLHALALAAFASLIGPFGGFFASGFKRAFDIKDFADTIPGHGGITDRMDCQFVMGVFTYVYHSSLIAEASIATALAAFAALPPSQQREALGQMNAILASNGGGSS